VRNDFDADGVCTVSSCASLIVHVSAFLLSHSSSYFRAHGLKAQVVFLPNGMIGSVYIASMRHNDNGILNMSNLSNACVSRFLMRFSAAAARICL
jgi:hypothetical protein